MTELNNKQIKAVDMVNFRKNVLDGQGHVILEGSFGTDLDIVNAARVSLQKQSPVLTEGDGKLIYYLMKNKHGTPFEHNAMKFNIKAPIFVFRQWHRHRIGVSYNEVSGRYSELPDEYFIPPAEAVRTQKGKPGHYTFEAASLEQAERFIARIVKAYDLLRDLYEESLADGIAKEQARLLNGVGQYSQMIFTCNARSLMAFLSLRNSPHAQSEIKEYAIAMEEAFRQVFPLTASAFVENGRIAP